MNLNELKKERKRIKNLFNKEYNYLTINKVNNGYTVEGLYCNEYVFKTKDALFKWLFNHLE